jgi:hypothetical protein
MAKFMKNVPPPETISAEPKTMKPISSSETMRMGMPMMLSTPIAWARAASAGVYCVPQSGPGIDSAKSGKTAKIAQMTKRTGPPQRRTPSSARRTSTAEAEVGSAGASMSQPRVRMLIAWLDR